MKPRPFHGLWFRRVLVLSGLGIGAAALALTAGCQERVVSARGLGSDQYRVEEPLYDPPGWERWMFGDPPRESRRNSLITRDNPE